MYVIGVVIETVVEIRHADGTIATGLAANVGATVYDEANIPDLPLVVTEILATGMYRAAFTPDAAGIWKVQWICTSPVCGRVKTYQVEADRIGIILTNVGDPTDVLATGSLHGKIGSNAIFVGHDTVKEELINMAITRRLQGL